MNRNTKILLSGIVIGAVITQLLNMIFSGQPLRIGGEIFVPALVLLIRQAVIKTVNIFTYDPKKIRRKTK